MGNQTIGRTHSRHDLLSDYNENDSTTIVQETEGRITMKQNRRYSFEQQEGTKKQTNDSILIVQKKKKHTSDPILIARNKEEEDKYQKTKMNDSILIVQKRKKGTNDSTM